MGKNAEGSKKKKMRRIGEWFSTMRTHLPLLLIGSVVILLLFFNEETSVSLNSKYDAEIRELNAEIRSNHDSAKYYRAKRNAILSGTHDLETIAREQYHMQRPTEDVYIIREK